MHETGRGLRRVGSFAITTLAAVFKSHPHLEVNEAVVGFLRQGDVAQDGCHGKATNPLGLAEPEHVR